MGALELFLSWMPGTEQADPQTLICRMLPRSQFLPARSFLQLHISSEITLLPNFLEWAMTELQAAPAQVIPRLTPGAAVTLAGWRAAVQCFKQVVCLVSIRNCTQMHICRVSLVSVLSCWPAEGGLQVARANIPIFPHCRDVTSHVLPWLSFWMREAGVAESPEILGRCLADRRDGRGGGPCAGTLAAPFSPATLGWSPWDWVSFTNSGSYIIPAIDAPGWGAA